MKVRLLFFVTIVLCLAVIAQAATFTVNKTTDSNDGVCDGDCSLREAVDAANASSDDDAIEFDSKVFAGEETITLSNGEIIIANNGTLSIFGPDARATINANGASRILTIEDDADVDIIGLRFTGGNGDGAANPGRAGAIYNNGGITLLEDVILIGNTANNGGGTVNTNSGQLTIRNSIISGNQALTSSGGGLQNFSSGTLIIEGSLISGNTSNSTTGGGGAQLNGTVNISNSTFAFNTAASGGDGGAISSNGTSLTITNVTFSQNTAQDLGGGLRRATTNTNVFVRNSIFAGNTATTADNDVSTNASLTSRGNNIVGDVGNSSGWIKSDLLDTDPLLGLFGDNGGSSETFLPMTGSPAIDGGQNCVVDGSCMDENASFNLDVDQRDVPRPAGANVDIGAVEVVASGPVDVRGRVVDQFGVGIPNAIVTVVTHSPARFGGTINVRANQFGNFTLRNLDSGTTYSATAFAKERSFGNTEFVASSKTGRVIVSEAVTFRQKK